MIIKYNVNIPAFEHSVTLTHVRDASDALIPFCNFLLSVGFDNDNIMDSIRLILKDYDAAKAYKAMALEEK